LGKQQFYGNQNTNSLIAVLSIENWVSVLLHSEADKGTSVYLTDEAQAPMVTGIPRGRLRLELTSLLVTEISLWVA